MHWTPETEPATSGSSNSSLKGQNKKKNLSSLKGETNLFDNYFHMNDYYFRNRFFKKNIIKQNKM